MAEFRKGTALIAEAAQSSGKGKRKFTPNIYWKAGDVRTVAFLTEAEEIPKVRLHQMVRIPDDSRESGYRYETFLCRKDPSMVDEFGGDCDLCDRVEADVADRFVALAIELEPIKEGKKVVRLEPVTSTVKRDDGTEVEYIRWGLITQAAKNFFSYFAAYAESQGDIRDVAWDIHREGGGTDTKYHSYVVMAGGSAVALPDISGYEEQIPSLEELLEEMGSEEKYEQVANLKPGSQPTFGGSSNKRDEESGTSIDASQSEFEKLKAELQGGQLPSY